MMLRTSAKNSDAEQGIHNQIAKGTKVQGDIKTEGVLRIDGTLIGNIESTGKVVVGATGKVEGTIRCLSANISGEVKAKVTVKDLLQLQSSAKLHGDISAGKLAIEPGADFSGACTMGAVVKEFARDEKATLAEKTA